MGPRSNPDPVDYDKALRISIHDLTVGDLDKGLPPTHLVRYLVEQEILALSEEHTRPP